MREKYMVINSDGQIEELFWTDDIVDAVDAVLYFEKKYDVYIHSDKEVHLLKVVSTLGSISKHH